MVALAVPPPPIRSPCCCVVSVASMSFCFWISLFRLAFCPASWFLSFATAFSVRCTVCLAPASALAAARNCSSCCWRLVDRWMRIADWARTACGSFEVSGASDEFMVPFWYAKEATCAILPCISWNAA